MVNGLQEISILGVRKFPLVSSVLRFRFRDPGWVKNQDPGQPGSCFRELRNNVLG
jgi:hypothetical protein